MSRRTTIRFSKASAITRSRADDLALFPDYLVCIPPDRNAAPENANLIEMLSSGLPVKVLVETRDLLEESARGRRPLRVRRAQRAAGE